SDVHPGIQPASRSAIGEDGPRDVKDSPFDAEEPIAIIGMSGRFPGARDIDEMWRYLAEGKSAISRVSAEY
ncbi:hypothetical protein F9U41_25840, partial [Pectobacterium versatile]|nr:hypothetical protein [Pectobacterium versatile]